MLDLIASVLVRGLNYLFGVIPIEFSLWMARRLGPFIYHISGKRRRVTYANLKAAFCGEKDPREIKRIAKNTYRNFAQTFVEILSLTKMNVPYMDKYVEIEGMPTFEEAYANPTGMILVSAHFDNWEISIADSALKGYRLYILARDQKMSRLNELLNRLRESKGNIVIRKGADIKNVFRALGEGKSVGILADQNAGAHGELLNLFGRPASTAVGPYRFAQKHGAWLLPVFIHRIKGPYHKITIEPYMVIKQDDGLEPYMKKYNAILEKHIRKDPDQWMWMHKKWKLTPLKKIMVLDDGKKGHLKQSLAVVKQIKRHRQERGFKPEHVEVEAVKIDFKNKAARAVFDSLSPFFGPRCHGCLKCLRRALKPESYDNAVRRYADVIVSCGSALRAVNKMLKYENNARNLAVLDPGPLNRGCFDVIVLPRHDFEGKRFPKKTKVVVTELAPNLIEPATSDERQATSDQRRPCIGLLFGGDNLHFGFGEELTRSVADGIKESASRINGCFYATTSRRTPDAAEDILKEELAGDSRCRGLVTARTDTDERTVEKIIAASDVMIVSGESISMVSEAVSSGRPVLVFMPDKKTPKRTKYEHFTEGLEKRGYVKMVRPAGMAGAVEDLIKRGSGMRPSDDDDRICKEMHRLF